MKFNRKIRLKTLTSIIILTLALTLSTAINIKPNRIISKRKPQDEEINTSAPVTPQYKYHYENNFDFYDFTWDSVFFASPLGEGTEWSQDSNDDLGLDLWFYNPYIEGNYEPFSLSASLFVVSNNTFKKQDDSTLGAYFDFHIDVDLLNIFNPTHTQVRSIDMILSILLPVGPIYVPIQLLNIYDIFPQKGTFFIPNFDLYIASDGKIRFSLMCFTYGFVEPNFIGGVNLNLKFEGLRVIQELLPKKPETEKRTLIFVHGWGSVPCTPQSWAAFFTPEVMSAYDKFIVINYVSNFYVYRYLGGNIFDNANWNILDMFQPITQDDSIGDISIVLKNYILQDHQNIGDNVDFICHSMGGLVTRYMIKHMYDGIRVAYNITLQRDFKIKNVAMMATPNHGVFWIPPFPPLVGQIEEMKPFSPWLNALNSNPLTGTEIPYAGRFIKWFTYRSGLIFDTRFPFFGLRHDNMVDVGSVLLLGAINRGWFQLDHEVMRQTPAIKTTIFNDLIKPPSIVNRIFDENTPGVIMRIDNLTLEPNYDTPGGKTLINVTLPIEDADDIDNTSVTLYVSTNNYPMNLEGNTSDTYIVGLPLAEGNYSFTITANELDGGLYNMSGILKIIDDDVKPPEFQFAPGNIDISDEDMLGGLLVSWNISDYSGISEANVILNGVEIRSYTNQGTITDSYLLPNDPGAYQFSFWARDNDDDAEHDPPGEDWLENSTERTIIIFDDDITPPNIQSSPGGDLSISDEEALGGVLVSWEISDDSGISEANVKLNGIEIRSYVDQGIITDSYLLPNEPGVYPISIWAKDGDNDSEDDWLEHSIERTITIYDDDLNPPDIQITPGDLTISVGDAEGGILIEWEISDDSGISSAYVLLNGTQIRSYGNYGTIIDSHLLTNQPGVYNFTIWAKDNDNDLEDDWLDYSTMISITIYEEDDIPPSPPGIPGYNIFVLLGILPVVIILISKKRRTFKF